MAQHKNFTVVIGLSIVVAAMLFGALMSAVIPPQADLAAAGSIVLQAEGSGAAESFGPLIVYAREPQAIRQ